MISVAVRVNKRLPRQRTPLTFRHSISMLYYLATASAYYFYYVTILTYHDRKVELLVQVIHHLVNVPIHEYHVEMSEMNITSCLTHEVFMKPTHWHVILCP